jgi:flagellar motility protein MotE (MotC chaperone)
MIGWGKGLAVFSLVAVAGLAASASQQPGPSVPDQGLAAVAAATPSDAEAKRIEQLQAESEMKAKEEELQRLSSDIDRQLKELEGLRKEMELAEAKRKADGEAKTKKLLAVYRGLKPEEAAKHLDKLDADLAIAILNRLDKKTLVRIIPFLTEPKVIRWTVENFVAEDEEGTVSIEEEPQPVTAAQGAREP